MTAPLRSALYASFWRVCRLLAGILSIVVMLDGLVPRSAPGGETVQAVEFAMGLVLLVTMIVLARAAA